MKKINQDKTFQFFVNITLFMFLCIELYPLIYVFSCSFSAPEAVSSGSVVFFPIDFNVNGYIKVLKYRDVWIGYANTILYTVSGTLVSLGVTIPCAYALSRKQFSSRTFIMLIFMITMYINGGLVPTYLNAKSLGLVDTRMFIIINGAVSVYNMIVAKTFFETSVPDEIIEAARIDGCNEFGIFFKVVLPLSKAIIAVLALYFAVPKWNSYFTEMIYLKDRSKYPLQSFLREILLESKIAEQAASTAGLKAEEVAYYMEMGQQSDLIKYCVIVVSTLPMLIIYPRIQKFFEKGVMIGSVKG